MTDTAEEVGTRVARARALAVLRVRSTALAAALLPTALTVLLGVSVMLGQSGSRTGVLSTVVLPALAVLAALVLLAALVVAVVVARARPVTTPAVPVDEGSAPDLYRLVHELADRLGVPAPGAIALTPDCDSWLEDRGHRSHRAAATRRGSDRDAAPSGAPVLVIGSPFLWWMRIGELRAVLAPVVAGTGPAQQPDIAEARRFVRGLDAAVAECAAPRHVLLRPGARAVGWTTRLMLRACGPHAAEMERGVASAAAERARDVDYGLRIAAQEQVGLACAGWDRMLTRVALPAWRAGRWPSRLDAGMVSALTELSRRDRLADTFTDRLGERPACDLLDAPGLADEAVSLLASRLFHTPPHGPGADWLPVDWAAYPEEVVDRTWRAHAGRLHKALGALPVHEDGVGTDDHGHSADPGPSTAVPAVSDAAGECVPPDAPTLGAVVERLARNVTPPVPVPAPAGAGRGEEKPAVARFVAEAVPYGRPPSAPRPSGSSPWAGPEPEPESGPSEVPDATDGTAVQGVPCPEAGGGPAQAGTAGEFPYEEGELSAGTFGELPYEEAEETGDDTVTGLLAASISAQLARETALPVAPAPADDGAFGDLALWQGNAAPLLPPQPPRTARELLAEHVTAMVCCASVDTAGGAPGLDWLDGPTLLVDGVRDTELAPAVRQLVYRGEARPLKEWAVRHGVRLEKPVRLV